MEKRDRIKVRIQLLEHGKELPLPQYETPGSSGVDLAAAIFDDIVIEPGKREIIPTGMKMQIPLGWEMQVRPRSGLAFKSGLTVLNTPGTVDSDYRGEVKVILYNSSELPFTVIRGMRIAQGVFSQVIQVEMEISEEELEQTQRGSGGFGHTGH
ncbi:dUTP diphosphatase [Candidatus Calescamantes bacterium]|nr:dUTP diphosphatase [Candidatus Calescamantes bacterium]